MNNNSNNDNTNMNINKISNNSEITEKDCER